MGRSFGKSVSGFSKIYFVCNQIQNALVWLCCLIQNYNSILVGIFVPAEVFSMFGKADNQPCWLRLCKNPLKKAQNGNWQP